MAASVSSASAATSSAALIRRAIRTPCPAQSERNSARPSFAAAVRSGRVSAFCSGNGKIQPAAGSSEPAASCPLTAVRYPPISRMNRFTMPRAGRPENARVMRV